MALLQTSEIKEGEVFNKYINNRMIRRNQNVIWAVTGPTGSGKSYCCLREVELWYKEHFNEPFPIRNCCFSIVEVMKLLNSGELKKGEVLIIEEGGVLINSLDFQQKVSKLFTFVLQSFRSMNVGIVINLPVLNMLNKSVRFLLHAHFVTAGINYQEKELKVKPFFRQVNQQRGEVYAKYIKIKHKGKVRKVKRFTYSMPSERLRKEYEKKKAKFVSDLNKDFVDDLERERKSVEDKMARKDLTDVELEIRKYLEQGMSVEEISTKRKTSLENTYQIIKNIKKKGYEVEIKGNYEENEGI